jgi:pimeloyl-ACP methyl ester carboxylesterase
MQADPIPRALVLVHGAWHGAWTYERVIPPLAGRGLRVLARDLPGHGLNARYPGRYFERPLDAASFAAEVSPAAGITLDAYVDSVVASIDLLRPHGVDRVTLVGHSMGGVVLTAVGERVPERIAQLVYLTAFMPADRVPAVAYIGAPENEGEMVGPQLLADPQRVGALRIDHRSGDPAYRARTVEAFFGDLEAADATACANLLTPDVPVQPMATPIALTRERWGALPRHYVRCLRDRAIRPALQDRFIAEADAFTPGNRTVVHTLDSSHSPFFSQPDALAELLAGIATR